MWKLIKAAGRKTFTSFVLMAFAYGAFLNDLAHGDYTRHTRNYFYIAVAVTLMTLCQFVWHVVKGRQMKKLDQ